MKKLEKTITEIIINDDISDSCKVYEIMKIFDSFETNMNQITKYANSIKDLSNTIKFDDGIDD